MHSFLKKFARNKTKNSPWTHGSLCAPKGSYDIPDDNMDEFYKLYDNHEDEKGITERKTPKYGKMVVDLDFHFKKKPDPRIINKTLIKKIVDYFTNILKECFKNEDNDDNMFMCVVLQRPAPYKKESKNGNTCYSDGLHIQFPHIICDYDIQHAIRNKALDEWSLVEDEDKILNMNINCTNSLNEIYDELVIKSTPWLLYGSTKPGLEPYDIVSIHNCDIDKKDLSDIKWIKLLSIRKGVSDGTKLDLTNKNVLAKYWHCKETREIVKKVLYIILDKKTPEIKDHKEAIIERTETYDISFIQKVLDLLVSDRNEQYKYWRNVGLALHYCSLTDKKENNDYLNLWITFSKQNDEYIKGECTYMWNKFNKYSTDHIVTLGTLIYYANEDSPTEMKKLNIETYIMKNKKLIPITITKIYEIVCTIDEVIIKLDTEFECFTERKHADNYNYIKIKPDGWCILCRNPKCSSDKYPATGFNHIPNNILEHIFEFKNILIEKSIENSKYFLFHNDDYLIFEDDKKLNQLMYLALNNTSNSISELIYYLYRDKYRCTDSNVWYEYIGHRWVPNSRTLARLISTDTVNYLTEMKKFYDKVIEKNNSEKKRNEATISAINELYKKLGNVCDGDKYMRKIQNTFYSYHTDFEEKLNNNKHLLCFNNGVYDLEQKIFRVGKLDDCISSCIKYNYISKPSKHRKQLDEFLESVLPNKDDLEYTLKYLSVCLTGHVLEHAALIMSGPDSSGKFMLLLLIRLALGTYYDVCKSSLLSSSDITSSKLIYLKHKRLVICEEPNDKPISVSTFKLLVGSECITQFSPTWKTIIMCKNMPYFGNFAKPSLYDKVKCIKFVNEFVDKPTKQNQFKKDYELSSKLELWVSDFLLLLITKYNEYTQNGLKETDNIKNAVIEYGKPEVIVLQFMEQCTTKADKHLFVCDLYAKYVVWFKEKFKNSNPCSSTDFNRRLASRYKVLAVRIGTTVKKGIKCIKFK